MTEIPTVTMAGVPDPLPDGLHVLDVREHAEWTYGHIEGATHIPLMELPQRLAELPDGRRSSCAGSAAARRRPWATWRARASTRSTSRAGCWTGRRPAGPSWARRTRRRASSDPFRRGRHDRGGPHAAQVLATYWLKASSCFFWASDRLSSIFATSACVASSSSSPISLTVSS